MLKLNSVGTAFSPSVITMLGGISGTAPALPVRDGACDSGLDIQTSPEGQSTSFAFCATAADVDVMMAVMESADQIPIRIDTCPKELVGAPQGAFVVGSLQRLPHGISAQTRSCM